MFFEFQLLIYIMFTAKQHAEQMKTIKSELELTKDQLETNGTYYYMYYMSPLILLNQ